ncbi:hypothetical protein [Streptomyces decoyicus]
MRGARLRHFAERVLSRRDPALQERGAQAIEGDPAATKTVQSDLAWIDLVLQAATAADSARPSLPATGSTHDTRAETALTGIASASLIAGAGSVLLSRRLRRSTP